MDETLNKNIKKLWELISENLKSSNSMSGFYSLLNNTEKLSSYMEVCGIINSSNLLFERLKAKNKNITELVQEDDFQNTLLFLSLKAINSIPLQLKSYKNGMIDDRGKPKRKPVSEEDFDSIKELDGVFRNLKDIFHKKINYIKNTDDELNKHHFSIEMYNKINKLKDNLGES